MKHKKQADTSPKVTDQNWNNPFIGLKIDLPAPPPPPPPPPPTKEEKQQANLSKEDLALLKAFGGDLVIGKEKAPAPKTRGVLSFQIQRKGKGGKTVTNVHGLKDLELPEQMELCALVKNALGIGARFQEGILELQGDQIQRAKDWFTKQNFTCK
ncbi:MAG: translation initiation factor [Lentisphaeria bacterium]|nr:translation initiation factor [Lentisphaeria bacterium]